MRSSHSLDRVDTAFDDDRLVADAGLLLPATLALHLGLREKIGRVRYAGATGLLTVRADSGFYRPISGGSAPAQLRRSCHSMVRAG